MPVRTWSERRTAIDAVLPVVKYRPADERDATAREIVDGKAALQALTGREVPLFAYPNGGPGRDFTAEHVAEMRAAGFEAAVTTAIGAATSATDPSGSRASRRGSGSRSSSTS